MWVALAVAAAVGGCGGSSEAQRPSGTFAGTPLRPARPAPPIALHDQDGRRVTLAQFRGKAVLVTFLYSHCPDVCPLIVGHLRAVQYGLGAKARRLQILAVSVDPKGDTPQAVRRFLHAQAMTGHMLWLIGTRAQLERTWKAWGVGVARDPTNPDVVEHSAPIYGVGASGKRLTVYPTSFSRAQIAHDVPLLERR
jgi:protein SCO1/2